MAANNDATYDAIVVGAGPAGLAARYHLKQRGVDHILLDRGRPGEVWRTQRWDTFALNTPNRFNSLSGKPFYPDNPDGFESPAALFRYFDEYAREMRLPLVGNTNVTSASRAADGASIEIETGNYTYHAANLVVAPRTQNVPKLPLAAQQVPPHIIQHPHCRLPQPTATAGRRGACRWERTVRSAGHRGPP